MTVSKSLRRSLVLLGLGSLLVAFVACGGDESEDGEGKNNAAETNGQYVPAEAPSMPPLPPGAGNRPPPPPPTSTGTTPPPQDSGPPPMDAGPKDAAADG